MGSPIRTLLGTLRRGPRKGVVVPHLEMHVAHACNLTCESCSHFSNSGHRGILSFEEIDAQMGPWSSRLFPRLFRLLGGEPALNPDLVRIVRLTRKRWPRSKIELVTNGFLLARHPELPAALEETGTRLYLTEHHASEEYQARLAPVRQLIAGWRAAHDFRFSVERSYDRWTRRHLGVGADVLPYEDGDVRTSWANCVCRDCKQLFEGHIYKCSPLPSLHLQKRKYPQLSAKWDPYLAYQPLAPTCTDAEIAAFFAAEGESACAMCPANPPRFDKPLPFAGARAKA